MLFKTFKQSDSPQRYLHVVGQIIGHKDLIELGKNDQGQLCYTTRKQYIQEAKLRDDIEAMMKTKDAIGSNQIERIIKNYTLSDEQQDSILLAFRRAAVGNLNDMARLALKEQQIISNEEIVIQVFEKEFPISVDERLLFRQNDKTIGLRNGDLGTVQSIKKNEFQVKLNSGELLTIPNTYNKIDCGYALTVHKSQGMTVKNSRVLIDSKYWERHLSFVAMTRHKESLKIYTDTMVIIIRFLI